eukprot:7359559-Pyramimonas_sp.AAC.1
MRPSTPAPLPRRSLYVSAPGMTIFHAPVQGSGRRACSPRFSAPGLRVDSRQTPLPHWPKRCLTCQSRAPPRSRL